MYNIIMESLIDEKIKTISKEIVEILIKENLTITSAESCTGGLFASTLVKNSGVSAIFKGSIVAYANEIKRDILGVDEETLEKFGAVSPECVSLMLDGVSKIFSSDFAIAISGVAGPDGGSLEKPVGTIFIGVKSRQKPNKIKKLTLKGDREDIQKSAILWAFRELIESDKKLFSKFMSNSLDK
jgi:nicotinamide-nucleotide amidase